MKRILLVEPGYKNKFPPLGLMKISSYHKRKGDFVKFVKGYNRSLLAEHWDRIYISTLFSFYWDITIKTIQFYRDAADSTEDVYVGGVMATLMGEEIRRLTGVKVVKGLLNDTTKIGYTDKINIDELIPDYNLLREIEYDYSLSDAYIAHATRGCPNKCLFCAVNKIEPTFEHYIPLRRQIIGIEEAYGPKQNLILMDNNILASDSFNKIVAEILDLGFQKGAVLNRKLRRLDFNQGTDAHYLTADKMALLAKTAVHPLRIAFDNIAMKRLYISKIKLARDSGVLNLSNYVLYNYRDTPEDFYQRLRINVLLNEELGTKIYSFPMKFVPLTAKDRSHIGKSWNKKILRGIQCILLATRGLIGPRRAFFEAAFGRSYEEFLRIAYMPEEYIINRRRHSANGASDWSMRYDKLLPGERTQFVGIVSGNHIKRDDVDKISSLRMRRLLEHYIEYN